MHGTNNKNKKVEFKFAFYFYFCFQHGQGAGVRPENKRMGHTHTHTECRHTHKKTGTKEGYLEAKEVLVQGNGLGAFTVVPGSSTDAQCAHIITPPWLRLIS